MIDSLAVEHFHGGSKCRGHLPGRGSCLQRPFTTSRRALRPWWRDSVFKMLQAGLRVNVNSDDPALFPTTMAAELDIAREDLGLSSHELVGLVRNGVEASFMDAAERQRVLERLDTEEALWSEK